MYCLYLLTLDVPALLQQTLSSPTSCTTSSPPCQEVCWGHRDTRSPLMGSLGLSGGELPHHTPTGHCGEITLALFSCPSRPVITQPSSDRTANLPQQLWSRLPPLPYLGRDFPAPFPAPTHTTQLQDRPLPSAPPRVRRCSPGPLPAPFSALPVPPPPGSHERKRRSCRRLPVPLLLQPWWGTIGPFLPLCSARGLGLG